jgi:hypothetical protein
MEVAKTAREAYDHIVKLREAMDTQDVAEVKKQLDGWRTKLKTSLDGMNELAKKAGEQAVFELEKPYEWKRLVTRQEHRWSEEMWATKPFAENLWGDNGKNVYDKLDKLRRFEEGLVSLKNYVREKKEKDNVRQEQLTPATGLERLLPQRYHRIFGMSDQNAMQFLRSLGAQAQIPEPNWVKATIDAQDITVLLGIPNGQKQLVEYFANAKESEPCFAVTLSGYSRAEAAGHGRKATERLSAFLGKIKNNEWTIRPKHRVYLHTRADEGKIIYTIVHEPIAETTEHAYIKVDSREELDLSTSLILPNRFAGLFEKSIKESYDELTRFGISVPLLNEEGKVTGELNENRMDSDGNGYIIAPIDIPEVPALLGIDKDLALTESFRHGHDRDGTQHMEFVFAYSDNANHNFERAATYLREQLGEPSRQTPSKVAMWSYKSGFVRVRMEGQRVFFQLVRK